MDQGRKRGLSFDPERAGKEVRHAPRWTNFRGKPVRTPAAPQMSAEQAAKGGAPPDLGGLAYRDPQFFVAGAIHDYGVEWDKILPHTEEGDRARSWVKKGVNVENFFTHFKGKFKGRAYDSVKPLPYQQGNAAICGKFEDFVSRTLEEWVTCGAIRVVGRVGEVSPPLVVMPLTVEPTKPRLCHDERYLNGWIGDHPFNLDTLKDVPRIVPGGSYMTSVDHKSGYQHVRLTEKSQGYFGIEWQGFYMVYNTLPFGFKASCYVYHTLSQMVASYGRNLGVPSLIYIDDGLNTEHNGEGSQLQLSGDKTGGFAQAELAVYMMCELWCRLGYTLSLSKSVLVPTQVLRFLGMLVDSIKGAFVLPQDKREEFGRLREGILSQRFVDIKTLQRLQGKCISFTLAVPAARLYIAEMSKSVAKGIRNSRLVPVEKELREEIEHWRFLDAWSGCCPWRGENHLQVLSLATDASTFKWGAVVDIGGVEAPVELADYWETGDSHPIHLKEAEALLATLWSVKDRIAGHRVDAFVDNMAVVWAWERQGCRDLELARIMKVLFSLVSSLNVDLHLIYIKSEENPADLPSRTLSWADSMLSEEAWGKLEKRFGPHSVDLMATDMNARRRGGEAIRHFTPCPMPGSAGVNVFSQDLSREARPYCYPPICLIGALLNFLIESGAGGCTLVVPDLVPRPVWWPRLQQWSRDRLTLGEKGQKGVIWVPTKKGYVKDEFGLKWDLIAVSLVF